MSVPEVIGLLALAVCSAGVQAGVGFGQGLLLAPALFAALTAPQAVVASLLLATLTNVLVLRGEARRPAPERRAVALLLGGAVPGMVVGLWVLDAISKSTLQVAVGVVVVIAVVLQSRTAPPGTHRGYGAPEVVAGAAAGVLNTATSLNGPPMALALARHPLGPSELRDTLTAALLSLNVVAIALLFATRSPSSLGDGLLATAILAPAIPAGHRLGRAAFVRMTAGQHRRALMVAVGLAGLASIAAGLLA